MPRIEFSGVTKSYADGTQAVADLNLVVEDGEFLCLLGPSGCGKSSTIRVCWLDSRRYLEGMVLADGSSHRSSAAPGARLRHDLRELCALPASNGL